MTYSFDIFDTCIVRKCGTPENMLDVLSLEAFNSVVEESARQTFVAARRKADNDTYGDSFAKLSDIYDALSYTHKDLKMKEKLLEVELDVERRMLMAVPSMRDKINTLRKSGHRIIFISDMYLSSEFLASVLKEQGLYNKETDGLYVSCEVGKRKTDGSLFEYVREKENLDYSSWIHYGDNLQSDIEQAKRLGIDAQLVHWGYTPYEKDWQNIYNARFKYADIMAGICRSLRLEIEDKGHRDFVLNVGAPLFVLFVYRVLKDADSRGIKELYFCARDAKVLYLAAQQFQSLFPQMGFHYLYISRTALYEGNSEVRMAYFKQCGLATKTEDVAIVDLRSSGKTQCVLNKQLAEAGFKPVRGYYYELFCTGTMDNNPGNYYAEFETPYYIKKNDYNRVFAHHQIIEMYFPLHNEARTIDYALKDDKAEPVCANDDSTELAEDNSGVLNKELHIVEHEQCFIRFAQLFAETNLHGYVDSIYENVTIPTWMRFCEEPNTYYLSALTDFRSCKRGTDCYLPYVKRMGLVELIKTRGRNTIFRRGSIIYSLPNWLVRILMGMRRR